MGLSGGGGGGSVDFSKSKLWRAMFPRLRAKRLLAWSESQVRRGTYGKGHIGKAVTTGLGEAGTGRPASRQGGGSSYVGR